MKKTLPSLTSLFIFTFAFVFPLLINANSNNLTCFNYPSTVCENDVTNPVASDPPAPDGTYTVDPASAVINRETGELDLTTVSAGTTYTITYSYDWGGSRTSCERIIEILPMDDASFGFPSSACIDDVIILADPSPTIPGLFSVSPPGPFIDPTGGTLDLTGAAPGVTYTITYATNRPNSDCPASFSRMISIYPMACPSNINVIAEPGVCGARVNYIAPTASGIPDSGLPSGSFFPVGTTTNVFTRCNGGTCQFDVVVTDNQPPIVICEDYILELDDNGQGTLTTDDVTGDGYVVGTLGGTLEAKVTEPGCVHPAIMDEICDCPPGYLATGYEGYQANDPNSSNLVVTQLTLKCQKLQLDGTLDAAISLSCSAAPQGNTGTFVDVPGSPNTVLVGIEGRLRCSFDQIGAYSKPLAEVMAGDANSTSTILTKIGGPTGTDFGPQYVPDGNAVIGMKTFVLDGPAPDAIPYFAGLALRYASISSLINGATDNCGTPVLSLSRSSFNCSHLGDQTVTLTATDANNLTADCTARVTVVDPIAPTVVCKNRTVELDADGLGSIVVGDLIMSENDNCEIVEREASKTDFDCSNLGDYTVVVTVRDQSGLTGNCNATVTVVDPIPPIARCMDVIVELDANGIGSISTSNINDGSSDNCPPPTLSFPDGTQTAFGCGDLGPQAVYLLATDMANLTSSCMATVTVQDNLAPTVVCKDVTLELNDAGMRSIVVGDVIMSDNDNCEIVNREVDITDFGCDDVGPNTVTVTVTDHVTLTGTCEATVLVKDVTPPNINCPDDINLYLGSFECAAIAEYSASAWDLCDGNIIPIQTDGSGFFSGDYFPRGTNIVEFTATDNSGNPATCSFNVIVNEIPLDQQQGSLACNGQVNITVDQNCEATVRPSQILLGGPYGCILDYDLDLFYDMALTQPVPTSPDVGPGEVGLILFTRVSGPNGPPCWGRIEVKDSQAPTIACQDVTVECNDDTAPSIFGPVFPAEVVDSCDPTLQPTYTETEQIDQCNPDWFKRITRVWTVTDSYGRSDVCTQVITVSPSVFTDIIVPPNYDGLPGNQPKLLCDEKETQANSGCGPVVGWNAIDPGEYVDGAGHDLYVGHPSPNDEFYGCGSVKWHGTGVPNVNNLCGMYSASFTDIRQDVCTSGNSSGCFTIIRTWLLFDWCTSYFEEVVQIIKVKDADGPTIADIADVTISTDPWTCDATYYVPNPWIDSNCSDISDWDVMSAVGTKTYNSTLDRYIISGIPIGVHQLVYTASDCCGNTTTLVVYLTVQDLVPPIVICEVFHTVSVGIDGMAKVFATTYDDGSYDACGNPTYFKSIRMDDLLGTFDGSDANQSSTDCDPANGDDSNSKPGNQIYFDDYAKFCCEDIGTPVMVVMRVFDINPGTGPVDPARMRQGGDLYGHYNECMVETTVADELPPYIVCPSDITISCDYWFDINEMSEFGKIALSAYDRDSIVLYDTDCNTGDYVRKSLGLDGVAGANCQFSAAFISETYIDNRVCGTGLISRIFTATDPQGRTATCAQRVYFVDCDPYYINDQTCNNTDPNDGIRWPCDVDLSECDAGTDPAQTGSPILYNEDNCSLVSVDKDDEIHTVVPGACFKIERTWVVTDWCHFDEDDSDNNNRYDPSDDGFVEGRWIYIQYIKVLNSDNPVIEPCDDVTLCAYNDDCTGTVELPVWVSDDCTPLDELVVDYKIDLNDDGHYDLLGSNVSPYPYSNPSGLQVVYFSEDNANANGTYPLGRHHIFWNVEDKCGNVSSCSYDFTIRDCKEPTPECDDLTFPIMPSSGQITVWANDFDEGSSDNCTSNVNLEWRISTENIGPGAPLPPSSATSFRVTCDDLDGASQVTIPVNVFAIDEAGNWNYCTTSVTVQDQNSVCNGPSYAMIYGHIENEEAENLENVNVRLTGSQNGMSETHLTDADGMFEFPGLPMLQNYSVEPEYNMGPLEGITTFDLVLISKHILNIERLDSPYKMIAADVNASGHITTLDMVDLRKLVLYIDTEFQNNTSWRFVDANFVFPNPEDPFGVAFPEVVDINGLAENTAADFMAIKTGDVNNSYSENSIGYANERNQRGDLIFKVDEDNFEKGEQVQIDFKASDFESIIGYQFSLNFDNSMLSFEDLITSELSGLKESNFGFALLEEGVITVSWNNKSALSISDNDILFSLVFEAKRGGTVSDLIELGSQYTKAEAYTAELNFKNVNIHFESTSLIEEFSLYQNQPNPFKDETVIGFYLPTGSVAQLSIYDISGKVIRIIEGEFTTGYNEIAINRSELAASGVLYYRLDTDKHTATRKMILID